MDLRKIIDEGKGFSKDNNLSFNKNAVEEKKEKWINKSIDYLQENYADSVLTRDFIEQTKMTNKNIGTMVSILQGLKDVEEEVGTLRD